MKTTNIERKIYASASKEEKARHNGVDTSKWGNDCPRISVPEGWQDHQHTQQLIRKYLNNEWVLYNLATRVAMIFVTEEENSLCRSSVMNTNTEQTVRLYQYINLTFLGYCLDIVIRDNDDEVPNECRINREDGRLNGSFIRKVHFMRCDNSRKNVILGYREEDRIQVDRSIIEGLFLSEKEEYISGLTDYGWLNLLKKKQLIQG